MAEAWQVDGRALMRAALVRALADDAAVSLLIIDPDGLGAINQSFGRGFGDNTLWRVWQCIEYIAGGGAGGRVFRIEDGAYGLLLVGGDALEAAIRAEQIRAGVVALRIRSPHGLLTVSVGGATRGPGMEVTAEEMVERASFRRRMAKERGRDRAITERFSSE